MSFWKTPMARAARWYHDMRERVGASLATRTPVLFGAIQLGQRHDLIDRSAALALFCMLTLVPALFGALSALGFLFSRMAIAATAAGIDVSDGPTAVERATQLLNTALPGVTWDPSPLVTALMQDKNTNASLSTATALLLGLTLFSRIDNNVRLIFGRKKRATWRAAGFMGLFFLGGSLLALVISIAAPLLDWSAQIARVGMDTLTAGQVDSWTLWLAISQTLPISLGFFVLVGWSTGTKRLARRRLLWASISFGVLWFLGQRVFSFYIGQVIKMNAVYGAITGVVALMLWLYYACLTFMSTVAVLAAAEQHASQRSLQPPASPSR